MVDTSQLELKEFLKLFAPTHELGREVLEMCPTQGACPRTTEYLQRQRLLHGNRSSNSEGAKEDYQILGVQDKEIDILKKRLALLQGQKEA